MRVCQCKIQLPGVIARPRLILLCLLVSVCAHGASPDEFPTAFSKFPIVSSASLFQQGPVDWKSFGPYVQHQQPCLWAFPAALVRGKDGGSAFPITAGDWQNDQTPSAAPPRPLLDERPIDWRSVAPNILHDQRTIWTFPTRLARGEDWKPTLEFLFVLGGLIALDSRDTPPFHQTTAFSGFNHTFTATNATLGTLLVPGAFYVIGHFRKDSYATNTSLLAGEALADSGIVALVLKNAIGRRRPSGIPTGGNYSDTWFETYHPLFNSNGSFPSGHAILAFSVATVFAQRYRNHRWVPWVAYGAATLVGFSRLTQQAHFPSDVFAGAALGYLISRDVVMPGREPEF
jgi:membrane-associated phospholipid phosphatase